MPQSAFACAVTALRAAADLRLGGLLQVALGGYERVFALLALSLVLAGAGMLLTRRTARWRSRTRSKPVPQEAPSQMAARSAFQRGKSPRASKT